MSQECLGVIKQKAFTVITQVGLDSGISKNGSR